MINNFHPLRSNRNAIHSLYSNPNMKKIRTRYVSYPISPKTKEVHFKILSNVYPSSELLRKRFGIDHNNCIFCDNDIETTEPLFIDCSYMLLHFGVIFMNGYRLDSKDSVDSRKKILFLVSTWRNWTRQKKP